MYGRSGSGRRVPRTAHTRTPARWPPAGPWSPPGSAGSECCRAGESRLVLSEEVPHQFFQKLVPPHPADDAAGIPVIGDVGGVARQQISHQLVQRVVAPFGQQAVDPGQNLPRSLQLIPGQRGNGPQESRPGGPVCRLRPFSFRGHGAHPLGLSHYTPTGRPGSRPRRLYTSTRPGTCSSSQRRPWARAAGTAPPSRPPAWAISGRPPPPPPAWVATSRTRLPAWSPRSTRSGVTTATNWARPLIWAPRRMTPLDNSRRIWSPNCRRASWSATCTWPVTTGTPAM